MSKQMVLPAVFTAIDKFSGPVNRMSTSAEKSMSRMERKFRKVGNAAFDISKKSATVAASIIAPMAIVANEAIKFEKSMANVSTLIDTNTESMEKMGDDVLAMATKLPVPIDELTASLYDIRSAGIAAELSMGTLEDSAKLSAAGLSTVEESTNIMTSALNAFSSEGLTSAQTADILFKTVKFGKTTIAELTAGFGAAAPIIESAGVSLADFQAATAALTLSGTPAAQAQNQIKAAIGKLKGPTQEMEKVFKALGVTTDQELIQKFGSLGAGFEAVQKEIENQGLSAKKTWGSMEALSGVTALTGAVNEQYISTLEEMTTGQNAINGAFDKQSKTGAASMQVMKNNLQALAISLGQAVLPLLTEMVAAITPIIQSMAKWMKNNKSTVKTIMKVAAVVGGLAVAVSVVSGVIGLATKAFGIYQFAMKAASAVTKAITAMQWLWNAAMMANPIGAIIAAVALLAAGIYGLTKAFSSQTQAERLSGEVRARALENTLDLRVEVTQLFKTLKSAEKGSDAFNQSLARLEEIQPGIVEQFNLMEGKLKDLTAAEKALKDSIIERAEAEARAEMIKEKLKEAQTLKDEGPGFFDSLMAFNDQVAAVTSFGMVGDINRTADDYNNAAIASLESDADVLAQQQVDAELGKTNGGVSNPLVNGLKTVTESLERNTVDINVNAPAGTTVSGSGGTGVNVGTTRN